MGCQKRKLFPGSPTRSLKVCLSSEYFVLPQHLDKGKLSCDALPTQGSKSSYVYEVHINEELKFGIMPTLAYLINGP